MSLRATPHTHIHTSSILSRLTTEVGHLVIMLFQESRAGMALEARCLGGGTLPPSPQASAEISKGNVQPQMASVSWNWGKSLRCHDVTSLLLVVRDQAQGVSRFEAS